MKLIETLIFTVCYNTFGYKITNFSKKGFYKLLLKIHKDNIYKRYQINKKLKNSDKLPFLLQIIKIFKKEK